MKRTRKSCFDAEEATGKMQASNDAERTKKWRKFST